MKVTEIKVLNIAQPNAHNVMFNGKNIENRNMPSSFRGTIAIYASKTYNKDRFEDQPVKKEECTFGCIIGFVDIVDCITESEVKNNTKEWFHGPYGYVFENVVVLKAPVEVLPPQGAVVWWTLDGANLKKCLQQLPSNMAIKPIVVAEEKTHIKRPQNASSVRLVPSVYLAEIIGSKPISYKQAITKFCDYLEENEIDQEEVNGKAILIADKALQKLFRNDKFSIEEAVEAIKANLTEQNK